MVHIKDLRIGNYVKCAVSNDAGLYKIEQLDGWMLIIGLSGVRRGEYYTERKIKPIKLTSKVLLCCGFVEDEIWGYSHTHLKCRWITQKLTGAEIETPFLRFDSTGKPPFIKTDVYFVHQLQNLYFALTSEELMIDEQELKRSIANRPNRITEP